MIGVVGEDRSGGDLVPACDGEVIGNQLPGLLLIHDDLLGPSRASTHSTSAFAHKAQRSKATMPVAVRLAVTTERTRGAGAG